MESSAAKKRRRLWIGLAFLTPNILGFLIFTLVPLIISLCMAFTNWDLKLHNMFRDNQIQFVGLDNFIRLFKESNFFRYLGNTLFFMMGIPFSMAGSLFAAILLTRKLDGGNSRVKSALLIVNTIIAVVSVCVSYILLKCGMFTPLTVLLISLAGLFLVVGTIFHSTLYRTLFFLPNFTAGVAVYLLWLKMYNPENGPINLTLQPILAKLAAFVQATNPLLFRGIGWFFLAGSCALFIWLLSRLIKWRDEGAVGELGILICGALLSLAMILISYWLRGYHSCNTYSNSVAAVFIVSLLVIGFLTFRKSPSFPSFLTKGIGSGIMLGSVGLVVILLAFAGFLIFDNLPVWGGDGVLEPPKWLVDYYWAKPAIMIMGLWISIGSNNMLLYVAGLSNIPPNLYEAADIDGASGFQRFWHVTWPQLAPVTFFIFVMSVIGGLQGGFEMARTMTKGGPAGATTTLSYYIYTEGFEVGRLGFASAVAWALFALVFIVTLFNWKFGSRYVND